MPRLAKILSYLALVGTIVPAILYLADRVALPALKLAMLIATLVWFVTVPFWMGRTRSSAKRGAGSE